MKHLTPVWLTQCGGTEYSETFQLFREQSSQNIFAVSEERECCFSMFILTANLWDGWTWKLLPGNKPPVSFMAEPLACIPTLLSIALQWLRPNEQFLPNKSVSSMVQFCDWAAILTASLHFSLSTNEIMIFVCCSCCTSPWLPAWLRFLLWQPSIQWVAVALLRKGLKMEAHNHFTTECTCCVVKLSLPLGRIMQPASYHVVTYML